MNILIKVGKELNNLIKIREHFSYKDLSLIEDSLELELENLFLSGAGGSPRSNKLRLIVKKIEVILNEKGSGVPPK
jgi:hypothetical protein